MKLLHTSDWHVGKAIRGRSRAVEHEAVLAEILGHAADNDVDVVLVAGDLFETASPPPDAEALVYRTLLALADTGADVVVVSGNHDNARRLRAVAPVFEAAGRLHLVTEPRRPDDGGVVQLSSSDGTDIRIAALPFVSQRGIVRAKDLMDTAVYEHSAAYSDRMRALVDALTASFQTDTVNVVMAHAFVHGGQLGGGERAAHFIDDYALSAQVFPGTAGYVALGHVHRAQQLAGGAPIHYCGSPLQLDFGDASTAKQVNLVELEPGRPATVTALPLMAGRSLRTVSGTLAELAEVVAELGDDVWVRAVVEEPRRAGLADDVREVMGEAVVDIRVDDNSAPEAPQRVQRTGRSPVELFAEFLAERNIDDGRVKAMFAELLDAELDEDAA